MTDAPGTRRLFVALPVPSDAAAVLVGVPHDAPGRWIPAASLHVTLRFLGDVAAEQEAAARTALAAIRKKPFHVEIRGLGLFEQPGEAVLHARVESVRNVTDLCARVTDVLGPAGFDFGARPYVPHVTLARMNPGHGVEKFIKKYDKSMNCSWLAEGFALYASGGVAVPAAGYECVEYYPLHP